MRVVTTGEKEVKIDANTTAQTLVFMSPILLTTEPTNADTILGVIREDPKVASLAEVIREKYGKGDMLASADFTNAYQDALMSVYSHLPVSVASALKGMPFQMSSAFGALSAIKFRSLDLDHLDCAVTPMTATYRIDCSSRAGKAASWIVDLHQLDPKQPGFAKGLPPDLDNRDFFSFIMGGLSDTEFVEGDSIAKRLDIISFAVDAAVSAITGQSRATYMEVPGDRDAVYIVRGFSGGRGLLTDKHEKSYLGNTPDGVKLDIRAAVANISAATINVVSIFVDLRSVFPSETIGTVVGAAINTAMAEYPKYFQTDRDPDVFAVLSFIKAVETDMLAAIGEEWAKSRPE